MSATLFFALYCLEAGLFFLVMPWTRLWTLNPLLHSNVTMSLVAGDPFVRGFISGFGVIHLIIGVKDILRISQRRHRRTRRGTLIRPRSFRSLHPLAPGFPLSLRRLLRAVESAADRARSRVRRRRCRRPQRPCFSPPIAALIFFVVRVVDSHSSSCCALDAVAMWSRRSSSAESSPSLSSSSLPLAA